MSVPDVDQELTRLLTAAREGTAPDAEARARVRAAVAAGLAVDAALPVGAAARGARGIKWWLLSALGGALVVGVVAWLWAPATAPAPASSVERASPSAVALEAAPTAAPAVQAQVSPAPEASANLLSVSSVSSVSSKARPSKAVASALEQSDELALVSSMQLALRSGNAAQVLALAGEHAQRFPQGALVQEREGARAIARCQLAEPAQRGAILGAFERVYSGSPYAARVRAACAP
ncbi:MAG TPA: hypothetical protein VHP33_37060 [Polyangiaceae bacterium]|nr:hypothetical protein [Polyangiaceae bacterium]